MELLPYPNKLIKSVMIKKNPTYCGSIVCQYVVEGEKLPKLAYFKTYENAVSYFYLECDLTNERHLQNSVILRREENDKTN